jgi:hypothetical protein
MTDVSESTEVMPLSRGATHDLGARAWPRRAWRAVAAHAFVLPVFLIIAIVIGWFVTEGTGRFFVVESFGTYYDALAHSMEHGRLDVPADVIPHESFIRDGKYYGYFGMTPALFRMPLNAVWPRADGRWSRTSLLVACLLSVLYTYRILLTLLRASAGDGAGRLADAGSDDASAERAIPAPVTECCLEKARDSTGWRLQSPPLPRATRFLNRALSSLDAQRSASPRAPLRVAANRRIVDRVIISLFLLCAGIGSTHLFLSSRAFIFHEAIAWGSTLALASAYYLLRYLLDAKLHLLLEAGATAFLAFFARPTAGAGAVFACGVLALLLLLQANSSRRLRATREWAARLWPRLGATPRTHPLRNGLLIGACVALTGVCYLATNYLKFHTFDGVPVQYYTQYIDDPYRMKITGGKQIHLGNIQTCFVAYFVRPGVEFRRQFPWIFMSSRRVFVYRGAAIDVIEGTSTVPASMPWALFLGAIGLAAALHGGSRARRAMRLPILGLAVGGSVIFVTVGITERYLHDLYPFLVLAAALGVAWLLGRRPRIKLPGALVLALLGLFAIAANSAFALEYQREIVWGVPPDRLTEFRHWRTHLDGLLFHKPPGTVSPGGDRSME